MKKKYYASRMEDDGMLSEDRSAPANMPQSTMIKFYKKNEYGTSFEPYDTVVGIDNQINADVSKARSHESKEKY